jgi:LruC domain-containing protein
MRTYRIVLFLLLTAGFAVLQNGCKKDLPDDNNNQDDTTSVTDINKLHVDAGFNWSTTRNVTLHIEARTNDNRPLKHIRMNVYDKNPGDSLENESGARVVYTGFTDDNGLFMANLNLATALSKIYVKPKYIGLETNAEIPVVGGVASYTFGGKMTKSGTKGLYTLNPKSKDKSGYLTMGTWNNKGVPNYLTTSDVVSDSLLADINASLPEYLPLPQSHPQYLASGNEANLVLTDSADVWVTFVHEGAGYRNVLGYYTYHKDSVPNSVSDLTNMTIIFPNTSFYNSGGGLHSGDKVYLGRFGPNTVIGYFLIANGFNKKKATVRTNRQVFYSNTNLNPEPSASLKQHMVMLNDDERNLLILGFEDIKRTKSYCDNDFNDAIFYVTANPITSVQTANIPPIDSPVDSDNDGVSDKFDDYPNDPTKALNNYYPAAGEFGTLAFEDLWPTRGDYDFNDLVMDYQFNQITNADNKIVQVDAKLVVRAIGAGYHNGFGFQMDLLSSDVSNVTGYSLHHNYINLSSNKTESGQNKATIIAFDNAFYVLHSPGGTFINTVVGNTYVTPDTLNLSISLVSPKTPAQVGSPPYNPFLIAKKTRGKEIHLPGYPPTALADTSYFGTGDDNTNLDESVYYKSKNNLPWGMNLPSSFAYPREKSSITQAHLKFGNWAQSNGFSYMDWYENKLGYRNNNHIYTH